MSTSRRPRFLVATLAVFLVIALSLLLVLNPLVRRIVLEPIVEGINAFRYVLGFAPQDLQWLAVLAVAAIALAGYVVARLPEQAPARSVRFKRRFPSDGPTMRAAWMLEKSVHSRFRREEVILELRDLAARSLAYHHGVSIDAAKDSLDTEDWIDDESVRSFLAMNKHAPSGARQDRFLDRVDHVLEQIERTYSGGLHGTQNSQ